MVGGEPAATARNKRGAIVPEKDPKGRPKFQCHELPKIKPRDKEEKENFACFPFSGGQRPKAIERRSIKPSSY